MIVLVDYQDKAVKKSVKEIQEVLDSPERVEESRKFLLQAPTGSGKTVMASSIVRGLADLEDRDFAFVFIAPNTLHSQSKASFEHHLKGENVTFLDSLPSGPLEKNSILFLNWASVNKAKNKMIADREDSRTITEVMAKTRDEKRDIILIIDESHHSAGSAISLDFINNISPRVIFEITATPKNDFSADDFADKIAARVKVARPDVIESGMICKSAVFSQDLDEHTKSFIAKFGRTNTDPNELYVWAALQERIKFESQLMAESDTLTPAYVPAVGIQLPSEGKADKDSKDELSKVDEQIAFLLNCGVQREEIAVYLADRKENMDEKNIPLDEVKVVIFKTAIAVGWDFPRLKVGALLRDTKTKSFAVQTLGRWMRQPERKQYDNEYLNSAYFYTDVELMPAAANGDIDVSIAKTVTIREKFKESAAKVQLTSVNRVRREPVVLDTGYFAKNWVKVLREEWKKQSSSDGNRAMLTTPNLSNFQLPATQIFDEMGFNPTNEALGAVKQVGCYVITNVDAVQSGEDSGFRQDKGAFSRHLSNFETEAEFEKAVHVVLAHHRVSNVDNIINHILTSIGRVTNLSTSTVARIIIAEKLLEVFISVIETVIAKFKLDHAEYFKDDQFAEVPWTPNESITILYTKNLKTGTIKNEPHEVSEESCYLYSFAPALGQGVGNSSNIEKEYFEYLESEAANGEVEWFAKNGDQGSEFFSLLYDVPVVGTNRNKKALFYPDWIIRRSDGSIDLQDTKKGNTMADPSTLSKQKAAVTFCKKLSENLGVEVRFAMVMSEKKYGKTVFYKSKQDATNLAEDDSANWEPIF